MACVTLTASVPSDWHLAVIPSATFSPETCGLDIIGADLRDVEPGELVWVTESDWLASLAKPQRASCILR